MSEQDQLHELYRPQTFDEYLGNRVLKEAVLSVIDRTHFFIFYGIRGAGKTTIARLIGKQLKIKSTDINEIDAADKTGVDDARLLKSMASYSSLSGGKKLYIIDEMHRLSGAAFDSLLKTLENPPAHVYFVGCTTEFDKIPTTVRSRAKTYEVKPLENKDADILIDWICKEEKIKLSAGIRQAILDQCEGIPREIVITIDKVADIKNEQDAISLIVGAKGNPKIKDLCQALMYKKSWKEVAAILKEIPDEPESIRYAVLGYMNAVLLGGGKFEKNAALIMMLFKDSFMYTKRSGLSMACYEIVN